MQNENNQNFNPNPSNHEMTNSSPEPGLSPKSSTPLVKNIVIWAISIGVVVGLALAIIYFLVGPTDNGNEHNNERSSSVESDNIDVDGPFLFPIEDVFSRTNEKGTIVTGKIERGKIEIGDEIEIIGFGTIKKAKVIDIEHLSSSGSLSIVLDVEKDDVERGKVLVAPGSINLYTYFKASLYILSKEEGGLDTPLVDGYKPQVYIRTADVQGSIELLPGMESIRLGDTQDVFIKLEISMPLEVGFKFSLRQGGRTIGMGEILELIE